MANPHITQVRNHLLETLAALRDRANPMDVERAKAVAHVASVLVDTAKAENDYLRITKGYNSPFLEHAPDETQRVSSSPSPFPTGGNVTRHRLQG